MSSRARNLTVSERRCVDCVAEGITTRRKAPNPGPRCATHWRSKRKTRKVDAWSKRLRDTYNITPAQYWAIYEAQGGKCALCRRATGATKRLAVDHDHGCCTGPVSCGRCVRSLCCSQCNRLLGHVRDSPEMLERFILYLLEPPGREVLREWNVR